MSSLRINYHTKAKERLQHHVPPSRTWSSGDWKPEGKKERCSEESQVLVKQLAGLLAALPITEERLSIGISQLGELFL